MGKVKKNFRLSEDIAEELREIAQTLGISETEAVSRAIHSFYLRLRGEEQSSVSGAIVPLSKYEQVQAQLSQALYRIGELEGTLKTKEELIQELRNRIEELKAKPSRRWWEFWR